MYFLKRDSKKSMNSKKVLAVTHIFPPREFGDHIALFTKGGEWYRSELSKSESYKDYVVKKLEFPGHKKIQWALSTYKWSECTYFIGEDYRLYLSNNGWVTKVEDVKQKVKSIHSVYRDINCYHLVTVDGNLLEYYYSQHRVKFIDFKNKIKNNIVNIEVTCGMNKEVYVLLDNGELYSYNNINYGEITEIRKVKDGVKWIELGNVCEEYSILAETTDNL